ncbi:MAG: hypothetical protein JNM07_04685 [Phycisphaerae bacterium]|nr:hypothetical protein [Phycisphaerae bacterium]
MAASPSTPSPSNNPGKKPIKAASPFFKPDQNRGPAPKQVRNTTPQGARRNIRAQSR